MCQSCGCSPCQKCGREIKEGLCCGCNKPAVECECKVVEVEKDIEQ